MIDTGHHAILDIYNVPFCVADDLEFWTSLCLKAAEVAKTKVLAKSSYKFEPQGVSGIILISESHISFHSFPEKNFVAFDFYSCGSKENFDNAIEWIVNELTDRVPEIFIKFKIIKRGERL